MSLRERRKKKERAEWLKLVLAAIVVVPVVVWAIWFAVDKVMNKPKYDPVTACRMHGTEIAPDGHVVVVIDKTDPLTTTQVDAVRVRLKRLVFDDLKPNTMLSLYVLGDKGVEKAAFEMCKMRDGSDADSLTENERLMRKNFDEFFYRPFNRILADLMATSHESKESPLFEVFQSVGINAFENVATHGPRRLIVYSDMLHNTKQYSLYQVKPSFENFKKTGYYQEVRPHLEGVEVELNYFANRPRFQTQANANFWRDYFRNAMADVVMVDTFGK